MDTQFLTNDFCAGHRSQLLQRDIDSAPSFLLSKLPSLFISGLWRLAQGTMACLISAPGLLDTMEYDGSCGHFSLMEGSRDIHENLTEEQIEALDAERTLQQSRKDVLKRGKEDKARGEVLRINNNMASEKYRCDLCDVVFGPALGCGDKIVPKSTSTMLPGSPKLSNAPEVKETAAKILKPGDTTAALPLLCRVSKISLGIS
jgi:hypothetical protein